MRIDFDKGTIDKSNGLDGELPSLGYEWDDNELFYTWRVVQADEDIDKEYGVIIDPQTNMALKANTTNNVVSSAVKGGFQIGVRADVTNDVKDGDKFIVSVRFPQGLTVLADHDVTVGKKAYVNAAASGGAFGDSGTAASDEIQGTWFLTSPTATSGTGLCILAGDRPTLPAVAP